MSRRDDLSGKKYGRLLVVEMAQQRSSSKKVMWVCKCDCGNEVTVIGSALKNGNTASCGCLHKEGVRKLFTTHGRSKTVEYHIWQGMMKRCYKPYVYAYPHYGGRGIKVCSEWQDFENFYRDMGEKPEWANSIDRINNDADYSPDNCRWATQKDQCRNKRNNHYLTLKGETKSAAEWAEMLSINVNTIYTRINHLGWDTERALAN